MKMAVINTGLVEGKESYCRISQNRAKWANNALYFSCYCLDARKFQSLERRLVFVTLISLRREK